MQLLKITDLAVGYDYYLFDGFNLTVNSGERVVIIGPSGCGKSSLLKAVIGQVDYQGKIDISASIGYMPQNLALLEHKTVEGNVKLPLIISGQDTNVDDDLFAQFGLLEHKHKYISELSGGQAQRVALMRSIVAGNNLLCIDEPLSKLDQITKEKMLNFFKQHFNSQIGVIYITHDLREAIELATKIIVFGDYPQVVDNNLSAVEMEIKLRQLLTSN